MDFTSSWISPVFALASIGFLSIITLQCRTLAKSSCTQVPTEENTVAEKNHYLAYPIVRIQENVYSATLTISNIGLDEADYQHFLQIRHPDIESPKDHW